MVALNTMENTFKLTLKTPLLRLSRTRAGDRVTCALFLSQDEDDVVKGLCEDLKQVDIRSKFLQGDNCDLDEEDDDGSIIKQKAEARDKRKKRSSPLTLLSVRLVFDQLLVKSRRKCSDSSQQGFRERRCQDTV